MDSMVEENGGNSSIDPLSGVGNGTGEDIQEHIPERTLNYHSLQTITILEVDKDSNSSKTTVPSSPRIS